MVKAARAGRRRILALGATALASWGGLPRASAASELHGSTLPVQIQIRVDAGHRLHPTQPLLTGTNMPWIYGSEGMMDPQGRLRDAMMARAREWAPPVIRYMGGEPVRGFRWRQGVGPLAQRPVVQPDAHQPAQRILFGTQEFLEVCEDLGSIPLVEVNMYEGAAADLARETADWVRHANASSLRSRRTGRVLPKVRYWELGNEPYVRDSRGPDGRTNPEFFRPASFARRLNAVMAAVRAADPSARIGIPFALDTLSGRPWRPNNEPATVVGEQLGYADQLLSALDRPQDVDFLALHFYMPQVAGEGPELLARLPNDEALYWGTVAGSETLRRHLQTVAEFWSKHPRTRGLSLPKLLVTEYNSFFTTARRNGKELAQNGYVATVAGALFVADLIRAMSQDDRIEAAMQWSLSGNWVFGAIKPADGVGAAPVRPVFHVMRMARELLVPGGHHVAHDVRVERVTQPGARVGYANPFPDMPLTTAVATREEKKLRVLVIHKDPTRGASLSLDLDGAVVRQVRVEQLKAPKVFASPDTPEAFVLENTSASLSADRRQVRWSQAPASVALVSLTL